MDTDTIYARVVKLEKERAILRHEMSRLPEPRTAAETKQREMLIRMLGNDDNSKIEQIKKILAS